MIRSSRLALLCVAALALFAAATSGAATPAELIAQADLAYTTRYVQDSMSEAIALYEAVLPALDELSEWNQAYVLNRLSQLCYEAALFADGHTPEDEELYTKGKDYAFRSLRLNEAFAEHESDGIEAALAYAIDVAALHWAASNWGMICGIHPIQGLMQQGSVNAMFARCVELDPGFWGGSSASSLGSLLIMTPGPLGGDDERGLELVEEAITSNPDYLHNRIILAEYWGFTYNMFGALTGVRDAELIERETAAILESEIGDWPFWNRRARIDAERLLALLRDHSD
jgi:hypothetical protein